MCATVCVRRGEGGGGALLCVCVCVCGGRGGQGTLCVCGGGGDQGGRGRRLCLLVCLWWGGSPAHLAVSVSLPRGAAPLSRNVQPCGPSVAGQTLF